MATTIPYLLTRGLGDFEAEPSVVFLPTRGFLAGDAAGPAGAGQVMGENRLLGA